MSFAFIKSFAFILKIRFCKPLLYQQTFNIWIKCNNSIPSNWHASTEINQKSRTHCKNTIVTPPSWWVLPQRSKGFIVCFPPQHPFHDPWEKFSPPSVKMDYRTAIHGWPLICGCCMVNVWPKNTSFGPIRWLWDAGWGVISYCYCNMKGVVSDETILLRVVSKE